MRSNFSKEFFTGNRKKLQTLFTGTAPIVITANGLTQRNSDITFPFRQDSNFWYLTGIDEPDIVLVIDKSKQYLIVPDRDEHRIAFDGEVDYQKLVDRSGIEAVYGEKEGWRRLSSRLKKVKHVAVLPAPKSYEDRLGMYTNPSRGRLISTIKSYNPDVDMLDIRQHLTRMRMIKRSEEIVAIRKAISITTKAFQKAEKQIEKAHNEQQIQKIFDKHFVTNSVAHAYQPIVAAGGNACTLHYIENNGSINSGDLILIDAGAEFANYASDITRTYATGPVSKRQRAVYEAVLEVQDFAYKHLVPGVTVKEYEKKVETFMGEKLRELGLIKAIDHDSVRKYYPHATSHHLGLDTHDVADYDRPLEPGMVLTVEPGIYIPEESIGIRIEDNVLIGQEGVEILSARLSRELK